MRESVNLPEVDVVDDDSMFFRRKGRVYRTTLARIRALIGGGGAGGGGPTAWDDVTDKPDTFPPSAHTHSIAAVSFLQDALDSKQAISFESVSKNLDARGAVLTHSGGNLTSIAYASGITKTLNYIDGNLTSIVLSGETPDGIALTKTLSYTGSDLTGIAYS